MLSPRQLFSLPRSIPHSKLFPPSHTARPHGSQSSSLPRSNLHLPSRSPGRPSRLAPQTPPNPRLRPGRHRNQPLHPRRTNLRPPRLRGFRRSRRGPPDVLHRRRIFHSRPDAREMDRPGRRHPRHPPLAGLRASRRLASRLVHDPRLRHRRHHLRRQHHGPRAPPRRPQRHGHHLRPRDDRHHPRRRRRRSLHDHHHPHLQRPRRRPLRQSRLDSRQSHAPPHPARDSRHDNRPPPFSPGSPHQRFRTFPPRRHRHLPGFCRRRASRRIFRSA